MTNSDVYVDYVTSACARDLILQMNGGVIDHDILQACTPVGSDLWVGYVDGNPVCAWGLVPPSILSDRAYLWLYASERVDEHKFLFVRYSQRVMEHLKGLYPVLYGTCDLGNARAIRWLQWLGARFDPPSGGKAMFHIGAAG